jgi:transposase
MSKKNEPTKIHHLLWKVPGYNVSIMKTYKSILGHSLNKPAKFRLDVINFSTKYGVKEAVEAFKVSRSTIYRWKKKLKDSGGKLESLIPKSTAPKKRRTMIVEPEVIQYISKLRKEHPHLGKRKIKPILDKHCKKEDLTTISESTIGKVIKRFNLFFYPPNNKKVYHNPNHKHRKRKKRRRVKYSPKPKSFGYLEIDTIVRFDQGIKYYVYNCLDVKLRFQFSLAYKRANSKNTLEFFKKLQRVYPIKRGIKKVQTDNGSEYQGLFEQYLKDQDIKQMFIYPRCPKINAYVERANRTLQEEFINWNIHLALTDLELFNQELIDYLVWYNTERPHESLGDKSPIDYLIIVSPESQKYVTCTSA